MMTVRLRQVKFQAFLAHCCCCLVSMHCGYELSCGFVEGPYDEIG